ncbi:hypothetical protein QE363_000759 [Sphingomonas sp. SORGH_AS870]|uniref:hypothetical protein n=1 Tax=Sphingomonas sp. SORGH_AS_0870 TaxID=3041801 RepID=UPI002861BCEF|nr:hypothetical protein [Sphingomonas sp. SORGH_AS_0870]MDR6144966.1 hypothetical protein [Sphingomonas sp. SORGH_AS_0870]
MKTLYAACLARLGLSEQAATHVHARDGQPIRLDNVKRWAAGSRPTPDFVWADLRAYEARIVDRSEAMREAWEDGGEGRTVGVRINGDPVNLMAAADFLLGCDETPPVLVNLED